MQAAAAATAWINNDANHETRGGLNDTSMSMSMVQSSESELQVQTKLANDAPYSESTTMPHTIDGVPADELIVFSIAAKFSQKKVSHPGRG